MRFEATLDPHSLRRVTAVGLGIDEPAPSWKLWINISWPSRPDRPRTVLPKALRGRLIAVKCVRRRQVLELFSFKPRIQPNGAILRPAYTFPARPGSGVGGPTLLYVRRFHSSGLPTISGVVFCWARPYLPITHRRRRRYHLEQRRLNRTKTRSTLPSLSLRQHSSDGVLFLLTSSLLSFRKPSAYL